MSWRNKLNLNLLIFEEKIEIAKFLAFQIYVSILGNMCK